MAAGKEKGKSSYAGDHWCKKMLIPSEIYLRAKNMSRKTARIPAHTQGE
ncbi:hypothetical protein RvY_01273 [Ramazzottius varieornatus]|uniref:Uncharacterized protein n=1 Tax=Ramazzottius varieornatus TaxID=947166 RepID=A0A1D1UQG5_RAMVA|nr:hypothetical protein RvY_01273 [Ramazzottius varieornatus]